LADEKKSRILSGGASVLVSDPERSVEWYKTLGFTVGRMHRLDEAIAYVYMHREDATLLLSSRQSLESVGAIPAGLKLGGTAISLKVSSVRAFHREISATLGSVPPPEPQGSRLELRLQDPDGYDIVFFEWC